MSTVQGGEDWYQYIDEFVDSLSYHEHQRLLNKVDFLRMREEFEKGVLPREHVDILIFELDTKKAS